MSETERPVEIIVVRRRPMLDHEDAHGGVWKVAFADFMTAMMAFFLVLWIVNSTSKETRVSVARYFNPVRLQETTAARKGPADEGTVVDTPSINAKDEVSHETQGDDDSNRGGGRATTGARNVLAPVLRPVELAPDRSVRDPFVRRSPPTLGTSDPHASPRTTPVGDASIARKNALRDAAVMRADLAASLGENFAELSGAIEVVTSDEGLAINVTDKSDLGMFAVGSAIPEPGLRNILSAVAAALRVRDGEIVVRGHTDSRRYRSGDLANWQLSAARALAAYNVLVEQGLDQQRIDHIEGYADRRLKLPDAPEARENRRIEIVLKTGPR